MSRLQTTTHAHTDTMHTHTHTHISTMTTTTTVRGRQKVLQSVQKIQREGGRARARARESDYIQVCADAGSATERISSASGGRICTPKRKAKKHAHRYTHTRTNSLCRSDAAQKIVCVCLEMQKCVQKKLSASKVLSRVERKFS